MMEVFLLYGLDDCYLDSDIDYINDMVEKIFIGNNGFIQDIDIILICKGDVCGQLGRYIIFGVIDFDDVFDVVDLVNVVRYFMYLVVLEVIVDGDIKFCDE